MKNITRTFAQSISRRNFLERMSFGTSLGLGLGAVFGSVHVQAVRLLSKETREENSVISEAQKIAPVLFDERVCGLGESPLWHPLRKALFWVDLPAKKVMGKSATSQYEWPMNEMVSALAWVDKDTLLLASESGLYRFDINSAEKTLLCALEADKPENRSNDGRADPWGGFWVGTMGKGATVDAGSFYRWYQGELRLLVANITVTNGLCFDAERHWVYYADSARNKIYRAPLNAETGWPEGQGQVFVDFSSSGWVPDGAVVDRQGNVWSAIWDAGLVACISPSGEILTTLNAETPRPTCPAFGGEHSTDLYLATAAYGMADKPVQRFAHGTTLVFSGAVVGIPEPCVKLN